MKLLAADGGHAASGLDEPGLADVVLQLLEPDRVADDPRELVVVGSVAERTAQVGLVQREQARAQVAVGRQANAVTIAAERLGHRVYEADLAVAVREPVDAGGRVGLAWLGLERIDGVDRVADLGSGQHLILIPGVVGIEWHELDEANLVRGPASELGERDRLVLGEPSYRDRV